MGPTWGPPGSCRPQIGLMLAPWTLLPGAWFYDGDVLVTIKTARFGQRHYWHKHANFYRSKSLKRYGSSIEPLKNTLPRISLLCFVFRCRDGPACTQWRMSATMSSELQPHVWLGWRNISQPMCLGGSRVQVSVPGIFDLGWMLKAFIVGSVIKDPLLPTWSNFNPRMDK